MKITSLLKLKHGSAMVELLVSISIIVVSLLGIFSLVSRSLSLNRVNAEQYVATYLAAEGIEVAKNIFDKGFLDATPATNEFYSIDDFSVLAEPPDNVYEISFDSKNFEASACSLAGKPTEGSVRKLFSSGCGEFIDFDEDTGMYGYGLVGSNVQKTKFRRLLIIDVPDEYGLSQPIEFRITSAVGWESRGGSFAVQLQDHFLPWQIP